MVLLVILILRRGKDFSKDFTRFMTVLFGQLEIPYHYVCNSSTYTYQEATSFMFKYPTHSQRKKKLGDKYQKS